MRFRARLLIASSLLIILLVVALGIGFYRYSSRLFERNAYANLSGLAARMSQQLDNLIRPMDFVTTYLLSNAGFMSSMASLSGLDPGTLGISSTSTKAGRPSTPRSSATPSPRTSTA